MLLIIDAFSALMALIRTVCVILCCLSLHSICGSVYEMFIVVRISSEVREESLVNYNPSYRVHFKFLYISLNHKIIQTVHINLMINTPIINNIVSIGNFTTQTSTC